MPNRSFIHHGTKFFKKAELLIYHSSFGDLLTTEKPKNIYNLFGIPLKVIVRV